MFEASLQEYMGLEGRNKGLFKHLLCLILFVAFFKFISQIANLLEENNDERYPQLSHCEPF